MIAALAASEYRPLSTFADARAMAASTPAPRSPALPCESCSLSSMATTAPNCATLTSAYTRDAIGPLVLCDATRVRATSFQWTLMLLGRALGSSERARDADGAVSGALILGALWSEHAVPHSAPTMSAPETSRDVFTLTSGAMSLGQQT